MGWLSSKKSDVPFIGDLEQMGDAEIRKLIKDGKVNGKNPRKVRDAARAIRLKTEGERGTGAIRAAAKGGGTGNRNYNNVPLKDRVHPAEYKRILEREAKKQGLL